jgi:hypothetical protein
MPHTADGDPHYPAFPPELSRASGMRSFFVSEGEQFASRSNLRIILG